MDKIAKTFNTEMHEPGPFVIVSEANGFFVGIARYEVNNDNVGLCYDWTPDLLNARKWNNQRDAIAVRKVLVETEGIDGSCFLIRRVFYTRGYTLEGTDY